VPELLLALPDWINDLARTLEVNTAVLTRDLIQVVVIWIGCFVAIRVVRVVSHRIERAVDDGDDSTLRSVARVVFVLLAVLLTLDVFIDIGPLLAGAGILGLAFSFGAQSLVKDIIAGFFYLLEGQFAVGDIIEVSGKAGVVERMTLRMVVLRDLKGIVHMIPNGEITTVSNMTRTWSRAVVDVGVAYDTDLDLAIGVFQEEAETMAADPAWKGRFDGAPEVLGIEGLDDSAITVRTLLKTRPGQQWSVQREFHRRIKGRLDKEGIEIPFPQRTLHVRYPSGGARGAPAL
jgi:small-conductance mechanosensitive channel